MEFIHKAKAEKTRTKVLSDQMEARRVKNKVCHFIAATNSLPNHVLLGCARASGSTSCREACGYLGGGTRSTRQGVNTHIRTRFLSTSLRSHHALSSQHPFSTCLYLMPCMLSQSHYRLTMLSKSAMEARYPVSECDRERDGGDPSCYHSGRSRCSCEVSHVR